MHMSQSAAATRIADALGRTTATVSGMANRIFSSSCGCQ
ncbi:hypothetical protein NY08_308 [Rhodococcus sp. B7740]|nr:hypothetical protein NY08_308 [Rhodococcus sp. B7740]